MKTKSGIPITDYEEKLPEDYRIKLFSEKGDNDDMEKDIRDAMKDTSKLELPFTLNIFPFKYKPKIIIDKRGNIKEYKKKNIVWQDGRKYVSESGESPDSETKEKLASPGAPKKNIEKISGRKVSLLEDIINFLGTNSRDEPSQINRDITQSIISEWVRQFMNSKSLCCYKRDLAVLFDDKTKIELIKEMFREKNIIILEIVTDEKYLRAKEKITKGAYIRKNHHFEDLIEQEVIEEPIHVLLSINDKISGLASVRDNSNFKSYFPTDMIIKDIIDNKLTNFFRDRGFNYEKDKERKITKEQKKMLPVVDLDVWREDFTIIGFIKVMEDYDTIEEIRDYSINGRDYSLLYSRLANFAMKLSKV